jgi:hypothetical protein
MNGASAYNADVAGCRQCGVLGWGVETGCQLCIKITRSALRFRKREGLCRTHFQNRLVKWAKWWPVSADMYPGLRRGVVSTQRRHVEYEYARLTLFHIAPLYRRTCYYCTRREDETRHTIQPLAQIVRDRAQMLVLLGCRIPAFGLLCFLPGRRFIEISIHASSQIGVEGVLGFGRPLARGGGLRSSTFTRGGCGLRRG